MCMHHELSYALEFPGLMMFACIAKPAVGGAIGVADASAVLGALPTTLVARFEREGWLLTRSYNDEIGATIAESFGSDDRSEVERYCQANAIELEWQPDGGLRTRQRRPAVVQHPLTGHRCWFNQIAFLNEWTMAPEVHEFLVDEYGADGLPFNTRFGNGDPIGADVVAADQRGLRGEHHPRGVGARRPVARRQRPLRPQQGAVRGAPRRARGDGRRGAPDGLLANGREVER